MRAACPNADVLHKAEAYGDPFRQQVLVAGFFDHQFAELDVERSMPRSAQRVDE